MTADESNQDWYAIPRTSVRDASGFFERGDALGPSNYRLKNERGWLRDKEEEVYLTDEQIEKFSIAESAEDFTPPEREWLFDLIDYETTFQDFIDKENYHGQVKMQRADSDRDYGILLDTKQEILNEELDRLMEIAEKWGTKGIETDLKGENAEFLLQSLSVMEPDDYEDLVDTAVKFRAPIFGDEQFERYGRLE